MATERQLLIVADDYGIGPATSRGILDLALEGHLSAAVLLVNTAFAPDAVHDWVRQGRPIELGWHPNLTLDRPISSVDDVPSLVDADGIFWSLGQFLGRLALGVIRPAEIELELRAQYRRFHELIGRPPRIVNSHQHVQVFHPVGEILLSILRHGQPIRPYVRRVREPWPLLAIIPGAVPKRTLLTTFGRMHARKQHNAGFPGNDWLAGVTNPECVVDPDFLVRWIKHIPGSLVELACHPGHHDPSLIDRDCPVHHLERRVQEFHLLRHPSFAEACRTARLRRITPGELGRSAHTRSQRHAA